MPRCKCLLQSRIQGLCKPPCITSWALCRALLNAAHLSLASSGVGAPSSAAQEPGSSCTEGCIWTQQHWQHACQSPLGGLRMDVWSQTQTYSIRSKHCRNLLAPRVMDVAVPSSSLTCQHPASCCRANMPSLPAADAPLAWKAKPCSPKAASGSSCTGAPCLNKALHRPS